MSDELTDEQARELADRWAAAHEYTQGRPPRDGCYRIKVCVSFGVVQGYGWCWCVVSASHRRSETLINPDSSSPNMWVRDEDVWWKGKPLDPADERALLGWVRRECEREAQRRTIMASAKRLSGQGCGYLPADEGERDTCIGLVLAGLMRETWLGPSEDEPDDAPDARGFVLTRKGDKVACDEGDEKDPDALAHHITTKLGGIFEEHPDLARELVRAATEAER